MMRVKGTGFLARRHTLEQQLGKERFEQWFQRWTQANPDFPLPVLATSWIPLAAFVRLHEALLREFYRGDEQHYWRFGSAGADWTLTQGPYKRLLDKPSVEEFVATAPTLYRAYYDGGSMTLSLAPEGQRLEGTLEEVEPGSRSTCLEYSIMGYLHRALELVSQRRVVHKALESFARRDARAVYQFVLL